MSETEIQLDTYRRTATIRDKNTSYEFKDVYMTGFNLSYEKSHEVYDPTSGRSYKSPIPQCVNITIDLMAADAYQSHIFSLPTDSCEHRICHTRNHEPAPSNVLGFDMHLSVGGTFDVKRFHTYVESGPDWINDAADEFKIWLQSLVATEIGR